jgi:hypothetical protein
MLLDPLADALAAAMGPKRAIWIAMQVKHAIKHKF